MESLGKDSQKRTEESRLLLSPSEDRKSIKQLHRKHNYQPDGRGVQLQQNNKDPLQINLDLSKAKFDPSLLTETDGLTLSQKEDLFKTALRPSYHEVLDSSEKVIFTENDYHSYQYCKDQIVTVLNKEHEIGELIGSLQKIPFFKNLYDMKVGVREGYTLKEHTSMVLEQFRRYQMENWESSLLTAKDFQLMLAIHDIGKPQAVLETGDKSKQHEYNGRIIPGFVKWLGISEEKSKLIVALTMQDHVGGFLQRARKMVSESVKRQEARKVAEKISEEAENIKIGIERYLDLITRYYRADAGSYTTDANPKAKVNLNHLFEKKTDINYTREFAKQIQKNYDILINEIKSIASRKEPEFKREDNRNKNRSSKLEDVINLKKQKRDAYRLLDSLPERSEQAILEVSKSKRGAAVPLTDKLKEGVLRYITPKEEKKLIEQQREGKVKAVKNFITHYESIHIVLSAIEAKNINKWIDAGKYLPQGHEFGKELQAKIQAVHSSSEGLEQLFSGEDNQAHASREEGVTSFTTKELSKLEEMKQAIEEISKKKLGSRGKKALEKMNVCYQDTKKKLSVVSDHPHTLGALENSLKDVSRRLYDLALYEANKLNLEVKSKNWDESTIANIVEDKSYAKYAQQSLHELNTQLERCFGLVKSKDTAAAVRQSLNPSEQRNSQEIQEANPSDDRCKQHDNLLTALKDLTNSYDQVITVKHVIEMVQARKVFAQSRDGKLVRKALEKFKPPQHLIEYHRDQSTKYWINKSISKVNTELMRKIIDTITNREKSAVEDLDQGLNMPNHPNHSLDDAVVVLEIEKTTVRLEKAQLTKQWSKKEWFSKLDDGQIKPVLKEYCESYLKALDDQVKTLVNEGDPAIWIRCQPQTLRKILEDGRFKSLFETATSGGRLNKKRRAKSEYGRIGIPLNMPAPFRFIYGYAANKSSGKAPIIKNVEWFGPVAVRLKPELREFALQMLDDSKKHSDGKSFLTCRPTFFDNADRHCFPSRSLPLRYKLFFEDNPFKIQGREDLAKKIPYQEVQMVRVDKEDIQEVVFCTPMVNKKLKNLLEQHAIAYRRRVKLFTVLTWCLYPPFRSLLRAGDAIAYNPHTETQK